MRVPVVRSSTQQANPCVGRTLGAFRLAHPGVDPPSDGVGILDVGSRFRNDVDGDDIGGKFPRFLVVG